MKALVGVTNLDWFADLSGVPDLVKVNFWQRSRITPGSGRCGWSETGARGRLIL